MYVTKEGQYLTRSVRRAIWKETAAPTPFKAGLRFGIWWRKVASRLARAVRHG